MNQPQPNHQLSALSRTKDYEKLGAPLKTPYSWCAMHLGNLFALFTIWENEPKEHQPLRLTLEGEMSQKPGHQERETIIDQALQNAIPTYGLLCQREPRIKVLTNQTGDPILIKLTIYRNNQGIAYAAFNQPTPTPTPQPPTKPTN